MSPNAQEQPQAATTDTPSAPELTTDQMVQSLMGAFTPQQESEGLDENTSFRFKQEFRNYITETKEVFRELLPDATRGQLAEFIEALGSPNAMGLPRDPAAVIKAIQRALATQNEKRSKAGKDAERDLPIEGPGTGKQAAKMEAPVSLNDAVRNISSQY